MDLIAYALVSVAAVGLAFLISVRWLTHSRAQQPDAPPPPIPSASSSPPVPTAPPSAPAGADPSQMPAAPAANTPSIPGSIPGTAPVSAAASVAAEVQGFLEPFFYDSKNRRDPFQAYTDFRPTENQPTLSPLQRFDLDDLRLVGIMWDVHNPKAMFLDPDKQVHVAGRDESIGRKNGYIAVIREGEVVVVESARKDGQIQYKPRVIRMER